VAIAQTLKLMGDRKPNEVEGRSLIVRSGRGDRTSEGRMNDRKQAEGLWAILFERLRQREGYGSRAIAQTLKLRGDRKTQFAQISVRIVESFGGSLYESF
jgi:hypothetical protein